MRALDLGVLAGLVGLAASAITACDNPREALIVSERARFREIAPDAYVIATCDTSSITDCTREVVIAGRVVTAQITTPSDAAWRPVPELSAWVDQVSSMFESALDLSGSLGRLEFEPRWHYVSEYRAASGEDEGRRVTCFLPQRVDLQECPAADIALIP